MVFMQSREHSRRGAGPRCGRHTSNPMAQGHGSRTTTTLPNLPAVAAHALRDPHASPPRRPTSTQAHTRAAQGDSRGAL